MVRSRAAAKRDRGRRARWRMKAALFRRSPGRAEDNVRVGQWSKGRAVGNHGGGSWFGSAWSRSERCLGTCGVGEKLAVGLMMWLL
jgi:hypothetical protein